MMAYQNGVVVSVLDQSGNPFREFSENGQRTARLVSGQEYKLRIKNKSGKRAYVTVNIDGTDVMTAGRRFIMHAYEEFDLERFVDDLNTGRKFKFMSAEEGGKTGEVQDPTHHLNGRVRVTVYPEHIMQHFLGMSGRMVTNGFDDVYGGKFTKGQGNWNASSGVEASCSTNSAASFTTLTSAAVPDVQQRDIGATAEGGQSNQNFSSSSEFFMTDAPFSIDVWLRVARTEPLKDLPWVFNVRDGSVFLNEKCVNGLGRASIEGTEMVLRIPLTIVRVKT